MFTEEYNDSRKKAQGVQCLSFLRQPTKQQCTLALKHIPEKLDHSETDLIINLDTDYLFLFSGNPTTPKSRLTSHRLHPESKKT